MKKCIEKKKLWKIVLTICIFFVVMYVFTKLIIPAQKATRKYNIAVEAYNKVVEKYNEAAEKTSLANIDGYNGPIN